MDCRRALLLHAYGRKLSCRDYYNSGWWIIWTFLILVKLSLPTTILLLKRFAWVVFFMRRANPLLFSQQTRFLLPIRLSLNWRYSDFLGGSHFQAIRTALSSYTTLTNNSRITLNLDGQKFSVIIRLLSPDDKVRTSDKMQILVSNQIYVGIACMVWM